MGVEEVNLPFLSKQGKIIEEWLYFHVKEFLAKFGPLNNIILHLKLHYVYCWLLILTIFCLVSI